MRLLVVEDDLTVATVLADRLSSQGHSVTLAHKGEEGADLVRTEPFDLMILDAILPAMDGVALTGELRAEGIDVPIVMISRKGSVADKVAGLRAGADDYVVKPFSVDELQARIEAVMRRRSSGGRARAPDLELDPSSRTVNVKGQAVELTAKEFDVLEYLARNRGRAVSRSELKKNVWGFQFEADTKVVDLYVHYVRKKLEAAGASDVIRTVRSVGYMMPPAR